MKVYAFIEEKLVIDFCVQDQLPANVVTKIDENEVIDFSNQIARAGLASMDLASTHQKLESFITGAVDKYHKMNIKKELVEVHIIVSKLLQDARTESETYIKYMFYNADHKVFIVVCIAWWDFPKPPVLPPVDIDSDETEYDDDDIPSFDEENIPQGKEGCEKDASSCIVADEILHPMFSSDGGDDIPSFDNGSGMEEDGNDQQSIDEGHIPREIESGPTEGQVKKCVPTCPPDFPTDSELRTAQELENERLFNQFAQPEEKRAIIQVDEKKKPQIYRSMRQLLLNRMCPAVFEI